MRPSGTTEMVRVRFDCVLVIKREAAWRGVDGARARDAVEGAPRKARESASKSELR